MEFFSWGSPKPGQTKASPENGLFQRVIRQVGQWFSWGAAVPTGSLPWRWRGWVPQLLWFQGCCRQHDRWSGEKRVGIGQVKMSENVLFLLRFSYFSCINTLRIVASLWLISRVQKSWFWQFLSVFLLLLWRSRFWEALALLFWKCSAPSSSCGWLHAVRTCRPWHVSEAAPCQSEKYFFILFLCPHSIPSHDLSSFNCVFLSGRLGCF